MVKVVGIAAVGNKGQLGLGGRLPWHDHEDMVWFRAMTQGRVCLVGKRTYDSMPLLEGRRVHMLTRDQKIQDILLHYDDEPQIMVIGGATIYKEWMSHINYWLITRIDYDGPSDVVMPSIWDDQLPAMRENFKIASMLSGLQGGELKKGNMTSARFYGAIVSTLTEVARKKWPGQV